MKEDNKENLDKNSREERSPVIVSISDIRGKDTTAPTTHGED